MNDSRRELSGRTAWVTGSSRGIGAAIARELAAAGARIVVHGRDEAATQAIAREVDGQAVIGDVTKAADIERMVREIGPIDIVVANAGGNLAPPAPFETLTEEAFRATVDLNLTSTFLTLKAVIPGMTARGRGVIVTLSSSAGRRAGPRSPIAYAAAKAGIELLTQDVALQVGPSGIRAVCIAPETILTEKNQRRIPADMQQTLIDAHPIRRLGTPEDVARAVRFFVSDDAGWITGVTLDIAGGATMVR